MIYFDNAATTKVSEKVLEKVIFSCKENFANSSALHKLGYESEQKIEQARKDISKIIGANQNEIYFTSGATESNNMAILGSALAYKKRGNKVITTKIEHPSVLNPFRELEKRGFNVVYLDVDNKGYVDINQLINELDNETILVSIMYVNNEIGTIQNIEHIAKIIKEKNKNTIFHTDAVQAFGKIKINVNNIDLMSVSGHKIHSLKGIGFLYIKNGVRLEKIIFGASQQNNMRSGTINNEGVISLACASKLAYENIDERYAHAKKIRNELINLKNLLDDTTINGDEENGLPYIISLSFKNVKGEVLLHALEQKGIYVSTGAACSNKGKKDFSTIACVAYENVGSTIRVSFSYENSIEEAKKFNEAILEIVPMLRKYQKK